MPPVSREEIKAYLIKRDRRLQALIRRFDYPVAGRKRDVYATLLHSIISQQLSVKAADTILSRVHALFPEHYPTPGLLAAIPASQLRAAGVSRPKIEYLKAVARFALDGGLEYEILRRRTDEEIIEHLTRIRGVGVWTVEMLLIFSFHRHDVFAVGDIGIQNAMIRLYDLREKGRELSSTMRDIAENWRPYRAIVSRYLWQWKGSGYA